LKKSGKPSRTCFLLLLDESHLILSTAAIVRRKKEQQSELVGQLNSYLLKFYCLWSKSKYWWNFSGKTILCS